METVAAALPLAVALVALAAGRWPATRAAALGCGLALLVALLPAYRPAPAALAAALLDGLVTTAAVVYVVFGGLLLFQVMEAGGATRRLATALASLSTDRTGLALLLVLGWAPFVESASGFGVGAAVTCPLLLALGFPHRRAILLALLGLCAVPWGALAIGFALGVVLAGVPWPATAALCALLCLPLLAYFAGLALTLAGGRAGWRRWPLAAVLVIVLGGGLWAVSGWLSVELAGLLAGLAATAVGAAWLVLAQRSRKGGPAGSVALPPGQPSLARAVTPYALLVGLLLATRLIGPLASALQSTLVVGMPGGAARLSVLANSGTWVLVAALGGALALGLPPVVVGKAMALAGRRWWRPAAATAGFVALGQIMLAAGMTDALATALTGLGPFFLAATAVLGVLGGYVTGSNAGANGMLAALCAEAARALGLSPVLVAAMLNAAAASVTMASAPRLLLTVAVAGVPAAERAAEEVAVTRRMLAVTVGTTAILVVLGGLLVVLPAT